jgi:hypothetical protein
MYSHMLQQGHKKKTASQPRSQLDHKILYYLHSGYWFSYTILKVKFNVDFKYVYLKKAKNADWRL